MTFQRRAGVPSAMGSLSCAIAACAFWTSGCGSSGSNRGVGDSGTGGTRTDDGGPAANGGAAASSGGGGAQSAGGTGSGGAAGASGGAGGTSGSGGGSGNHATGGAAGATSSTSASRHKAVPLGGGNTSPNGYWEYLPPSYDGASPAPLLVFWHGIGEDGNGGSDLSKVANNGPPLVIKNNAWPDARPFIVLSPQYTGVSGEIAPGRGCPASANVDAFLTFALTRYKVDPKRVFLTGLSCGAIGSWDYLADHKGAVVAAAVLVAGNPGDPTAAGSAWQRAGCSLSETALWSFHGDHDSVVPYAPDHDTLQKVSACPSPPGRVATFTTIPGGDHLVWGPVYDLTGGYGDVYQWLLDNAKP